MSVGVTVAANPQAAVAAVRQLGRSFEELRRIVRDTGGDLNSLSQDVRDDMSAAQSAFDSFLQTRAGAPFARRLGTYGQGRDLFNINPGLMGSTRQSSNAAYNQMVQLALSGMAPPAGGGGGQQPPEEHGGGGMSGMFAMGRRFLPWLSAGYAINKIQQSASSENNRLESLDEFMRSSNASGDHFEHLNDEVKKLADGLILTHQEAQNLARSFSRVSGATGDGALRGANTAGGFALGFGMDPGAAAQHFGSLAFYGRNRNKPEDKQNAILIGETIARSGMWAKADEMLGAFSRFQESTAQRTLSAPDLGQLAGLLAAMNQSGRPGLAGAGGMSLIDSINSSIISGGGGGDAGQAMMYRAIAQATGLGGNPFKMKMQMEEGIGGGNLDAVMRMFAGSKMPDEQRWAIMGQMLGMNMHQAQAWEQVYGASGATGMGQLPEILQQAGLNVEDIPATAIRRLSNIQLGSDGKLSEADRKLAREIVGQPLEDTAGMRSRMASTELQNIVAGIGEAVGRIESHVGKIAAAVPEAVATGAVSPQAALPMSTLRTYRERAMSVGFQP